MLTRFEEFIEGNSLCTKGQTVLLAVSGGIDSMVMFDLFVKGGYRIVVAHANFQLRGRDSDNDMKFVAEQCRALSVSFLFKAFETKNYARERRLSTQMAARELRYAWFRELIDGGHADSVATAHHLNDSIETVLLNLLRGGGVQDLAGIPVVHRPVIRPMLFAARSDIEHYAARNGIAWREDASNKTDDYQRNVLRNHVIDHLREINPSLENSFYRTMQRARGEGELIQAALGAWKSRYWKTLPDRVLLAKEGLVSIRNKEAILLHLLEPLGFSFSVCEDMAASLYSQPGKTFNSSSHQAVIDREDIIISRHAEVWTEVEIKSVEPESQLGPYRLHMSESNSPDFVADSALGFLDKSKIRFPLTWRHWRHGDFFYPLGMDHRKKVSDFLVDEKYPVTDKETVTVLESGDRIVCLPGIRIDNRFRITKETREVLIVRLDKT